MLGEHLREQRRAAAPGADDEAIHLRLRQAEDASSDVNADAGRYERRFRSAIPIKPIASSAAVFGSGIGVAFWYTIAVERSASTSPFSPKVPVMMPSPPRSSGMATGGIASA